MGTGARRAGTARGLRAGTAGVIAMIAAAAVGCSSAEDQVQSIGYAVDNVLTTYNGNTVDGAASGARQAFSRVLTGLSYIGPEGSALSDGDVGTAATVPADVLTVAVKLNPQSVYSDGVPMACDDLVLAWAAGSGRFPMFRSADKAGYADIDRVDCQSGSKDATIVFRPGRAFADWRALFGATALMPAHVAARVAGVPDLVGAVASNDVPALERVAEFWNNGWMLTPDQLDLTLFPASGPYRIESYTSDGGLVLVANERWWGNKPATAQIVVWPKGTDLESKTASGEVDVIDAGAGSMPGLSPGDGFAVVTAPSRSSEQLVLSTSGVFESTEARRALALCVPRQQLFDQLGHPDFDKQAGLGSGVLSSRIVQPDMLIYPSVAGIEGGRYLHPDVPAAVAARTASGQGPITVRVGYLAPDTRRAATVKAIAEACAPADITVEDAGSPEFSPTALGAGGLDAILGGTASAQGAAGTDSEVPPVYSLVGGNGTNFGGYHNGRITAIAEQLAVDTAEGSRLNLSTEAEGILWNDLPSIPLFNEPRTTVFADGLHAAVPNPTVSGVGWNMDRWILLR